MSNRTLRKYNLLLTFHIHSRFSCDKKQPSHRRKKQWWKEIRKPKKTTRTFCCWCCCCWRKRRWRSTQQWERDGAKKMPFCACLSNSGVTLIDLLAVLCYYGHVLLYFDGDYIGESKTKKKPSHKGKRIRFLPNQQRTAHSTICVYTDLMPIFLNGSNWWNFCLNLTSFPFVFFSPSSRNLQPSTHMHE